jgi:hypothetical protein
MPRWRVADSARRVRTSGRVEAVDDREAIGKSATQFNITPARRNKIVVTKLEQNREG